MFSALFISRPKLALVISLVLTIMGAIGYMVLPVAQFPDITPPVVSVTTTYTGANAETVENTVAAPIEAQDGNEALARNSTHNVTYPIRHGAYLKEMAAPTSLFISYA